MKKILSLILALSMCLAISASAFAAFDDVAADAWYANAVSYVSENGLFSGTSDKAFSPNDTMTRAMFVTVLARMENVNSEDIANNNRFTDIDFSSWSGYAIIWASGMHLVSGTTETTFSPDTAITREQIAAILMRYFVSKGAVPPQNSTAVSVFGDANKCSEYAREAVEMMRRSGFIAGDNHGNFNPTNNITRAEAATILMRIHTYLKTGELPQLAPQNPNISPGLEEKPEDAVVGNFKITNYTFPTFLLVGETYGLETTSAAVSWHSENTAIATVSASGVVTGVSYGLVNIYAKNADGETTNKVNIRVTQSLEPAIGSMDTRKVSFDLYSDGSCRFYVTSEASDDTRSWGGSPEFDIIISKRTNATETVTNTAAVGNAYSFVTSNSSVAFMDGAKIVPVGSGTATITATHLRTGESWTYTVTVNAVNITGDFAFTERATINIFVGETYKAFYNGENLTKLDIQGKSSNPSVAEVVAGSGTIVLGSEGEYISIEGRSEGTAIITATSNLGTTSSITVNVIDLEARRDAQTAEMLSGINNSMTDMEKLLVICNYIKNNYYYSYTHSTALGMFAFGHGDCWAYSYLLSYFCDVVGFENNIYTSYYSASEGIWHTSNRVLLDEGWYHVDCSVNDGTYIEIQKIDYDGT